MARKVPDEEKAAKANAKAAAKADHAPALEVIAKVVSKVSENAVDANSDFQKHPKFAKFNSEGAN
jgi:hypothetical protein